MRDAVVSRWGDGSGARRRGGPRRRGAARLRHAGGSRVAGAAAVAARRCAHGGVARGASPPREPAPRALVVEMPLLFEAGMEDGFDATIAVIADEDVRAERAGARGHAARRRADRAAAHAGGEGGAGRSRRPQRPGSSRHSSRSCRVCLRSWSSMSTRSVSTRPRGAGRPRRPSAAAPAPGRPPAAAAPRRRGARRGRDPGPDRAVRGPRRAGGHPPAPPRRHHPPAGGRQAPRPLADRRRDLHGVALPRPDVPRGRQGPHADPAQHGGLHRAQVRGDGVRAAATSPRRRSTSPTGRGTCATCSTATTAAWS